MDRQIDLAGKWLSHKSESGDKSPQSKKVAMVHTGQREKLRVAILFGGCSGEHEVSIDSAASVLDALDQQRYDPLPIYLDRQGSWSHTSPRDAKNANVGTTAVPFQLLSQEVDVVFPVLHGTHGEDGAMQGLLQILDVPFVGPGVLAAATAMDKAIFKRVMMSHGFPILPWELVTAAQLTNSVKGVVDRIESSLKYPVFTKPANLGSSVGISRCSNWRELVAGLKEARKYDRRIVVEQGLVPRELEIAILGNDDPQASVVGEIRPQRPFYDYTAKYVSGDSELLIPAPLDDQLVKQARELAICTYEAIDGQGMARVDLFLDPTDNRLYVNEINTIPGFTQMSMFPKLWEASGICYPDLLDRLIDLGLERTRNSQSLKRTYDDDSNS
ncbi:MAG: D-alanine--D-alanine ligase family protein [Candidatus Paceibacterota bacterium]